MTFWYKIRFINSLLQIANTLFYQAIREFGCFSDAEIIQSYTHSYTDSINEISVDEQKLELFKTVFHMSFDTANKWYVLEKYYLRIFLFIAISVLNFYWIHFFVLQGHVF